ncbi:hypothetical protein [Bacillus phage vB_BceS-M2]|nr:hypothetical protein PBC5_091 [Bacillus phage PBC5]
MENIKDDVKCQTCIFYGLCVAAELPHCNGEEYYEKGE